MSRDTASHDAAAVLRAIDRWERDGLIGPEVAGRLRNEARATASSGTRQLSQYVIAGTAAVVLLIAGGVFLDWWWPLLGESARSGLLAALAVIVLSIGVALERRQGWLPVSYLMQTAALGLLLGAFMYSERAWADMTVGGFIAGFLSAAAPVVLAPRAMKRNVVMPAVHLAFGLGFLAVFLDRATSLSGDAIVWVLDGVLALTVLLLLRMVQRDPFGDVRPWALNALVTAMLAGFVLVIATALGPLDLNEEAIWPLDAWLALCLLLTLRGLARQDGPGRGLLARLFTYLVFFWIPLGFFTAIEAMDGPPELAVLLVGGGGVAAFLHARAQGIRDGMIVAALAFIVPMWYWGIERGGAIGAVLALLLTAGVLFWVAGRSAEVEEGGG